jgi:hypothetical protein
MNTDYYSVKSLIIVLLLLPLGIVIHGQQYVETDEQEDSFFIDSLSTADYSQNILKVPALKKVDFSFNTGLMVGITGKKNYFTATYFAPSVVYNTGSRLRIKAGGMIYLNSFNSPPEPVSQAEVYPVGPMHQFALFVAADYFITNRLTLTGTVYKTLVNDPVQQKKAPEVYNRYAATYRLPSQYMSLGLNYRITRGLTLGAEVRFSDQYQPGFNLFPQYPQSSPLYW